MTRQDFSHRPEGASTPPCAPAGTWRVLPISGIFDIVYEDSGGAWTNRTLEARELKLGPGRTLLGGIDLACGGYRGFRVDRIRRLTDQSTGERIKAGILNRLFARTRAGRSPRPRLPVPTFDAAA